MANTPPTMLYGPNGRPVSPQKDRDGVASGVGVQSGFFRPLLLQDPEELSESRRRHETYRTMVQTDSYVSETIRLVTLPLLSQAQWSVKSPLGHGPTAEGVDPLDQGNAEGDQQDAQSARRVPKKKGLPSRSGSKAALVGGLPQPTGYTEEGATDEEATETPDVGRAEDAAALVACSLFGQTSDDYGWQYAQRTPFSQFLRECMSCLTHGFSLFHKTAKAVEGKLVYKRLHWLEPSSIWRWDIDGNDELRGVWRNYIRPDNTPINGEYLPVEELFLVVWEVMGARYEGVPFIRSQFGPWKRKEFIQKCKMIAVQQAAVGQPWAKYDPNQFGGQGDAGTNEKRIEDFLQSSLGSGLGTAYLVAPNPTLEVGYMRLEAAALEAFDKLTTHENLAEAHGGSSKSMMLGEIPGGSRSTAQTQKNTDAIMAQALALIMSEQIMRGVNNVKGLVEELVEWNYGSDMRALPVIHVEGVDPDDAVRNGKQVAAYASAGLVKYRPSLEQKLLQGAEIFLDQDDFDTELHPELLAPPPAPNASEGGKKGIDTKLMPTESVTDSGLEKPKPNRGAMSASRRARIEVLLAAVGDTMRGDGPQEVPVQSPYGRTPTWFESKVCVLGTIAGALNDGGGQVLASLRAARDAMTVDLESRLRSRTRETAQALRGARPTGRSDMVAKLAGRLVDVARVGRQHAKEELRRQQADPKESRYWFGEGDVVPPGGVPPSVPSAVPEDTDIQAMIGEMVNEMRLAAGVAMDEGWARLLSEALAEFDRLMRTGATAQAAAEAVGGFLRGLSDTPEMLASRQMVGVAYNEGRGVAAVEAAANGDATWARRVEVLDNRTCQPCAGLDGIEVRIGTLEFEQLMPPAQCSGGDNCRGFYVILADSALDAAREG